MTIIHNTAAYEDYPFEAIDNETLLLLKRVGARLTSVYEQARINGILKCLECYLQVTNQKLSFSSSDFELIFKHFIGALNSNRLVDSSLIWKYTMTRVWVALLNQLRCDFPAIIIPEPRINSTHVSSDIQPWVDSFNVALLNQEKEWLWRGWHSVNRNGQTSFFPLYPVYRRLGKEFTNQFFEACDLYFRTRKSTSVPCLLPLTRFIDQYSEDFTPSDLLRPEFVGQFWRDFFIFFVTTSYANGSGMRITSIITQWRNHFLAFIKESLIGSGLFVEPWGALPSPEPKYVRGARTNIQTTSSGHEIKTKLLTHIPLHASDEDALRLLFGQIEADFNCVVIWAEWCCLELWQRYERRLELAKKGIPRFIQSIGTNSGGNIWITNRKNPDCLKNAAATFSHHGFLTGKDISLTSIYPRPLNKTAEELALPITDALLPHCMLLVAEHPAITPSFLEKFEIFDKNGKQTGFVKTDSGYQLVGYKSRRGPSLAQQIISLTPKAAEVVHQILALTESLRKYLKSHNDDQWRYMLLTCKQGFGYPSCYRNMSTSTSNSERLLKLAESFGNTSDLTFTERYDLVSRLSLNSLRASAGVLVYLKTNSAEKMSKALGHAAYNPKLLDHYLPKPILDFFQERWVRIFQTGIIVESLKDSKYLLEASDFKNMEELHQFLSHHAIRLIPQHLINPDDDNESLCAASQKTGSEIVFGINLGILSALLSLQMAVDETKKSISAKASYWAGISRRLIHHIESELSNRPDIQICLKEAYKHANPSRMEALIHAE